MRPTRLASFAAACVAAFSNVAVAQDNPTGDAVVQRIYDEGMRRSQAARFGQVLMDSIGPRLTGSAANRAANDWLRRPYKSGGGGGKKEQERTRRERAGA